MLHNYSVTQESACFLLELLFLHKLLFVVDADAVTPSSNTRSYTRRSVPSTFCNFSVFSPNFLNFSHIFPTLPNFIKLFFLFDELVCIFLRFLKLFSTFQNVSKLFRTLHKFAKHFQLLSTLFNFSSYFEVFGWSWLKTTSIQFYKKF